MSPSTERFLYLVDESDEYAQTENWASILKGIVKTFATLRLPDAVAHVPSLDVSASWIAVGDKQVHDAAYAAARDAGKQIYLYNGIRPATGSFATEDDGIALRALAWAQYKKKIDRWFFWEATYYKDYQGGRGNTNLFVNAQTFGGKPTLSATRGMTGWNYSNGDGVLFYPGTDKKFPSQSRGLLGPIASLRLKHWRRGVQDVDYLALAEAKNPAAVAAIVERMVPKILWENDVADRADPSYVHCPISWPTDPDIWEVARAELVSIIKG